MSDLRCRCPGFTDDDPCQDLATQEDGLCDLCRCEHGCCIDHGHPYVGLTAEQRHQRRRAGFDPEVLEAWRRFDGCKARREVSVEGVVPA